MNAKDFNVRANNMLQDTTHVFDNTSRVTFEDGTSRKAKESDTQFGWKWLRISDTVAPVLLATSFNLDCLAVADKICKGVFVVRLVVTDNQSGKTWSRIFPVKWNPNPNEVPAGVTECAALPLFGDMSPDKWVEQASDQMNLVPHYHGVCFDENRIGDIDGNGVVGSPDVLLVTGHFGDGSAH